MATVYKLCERGELRHFRVSNAIRIPASALAEYLAGGGADPAPGSDATAPDGAEL